MLNKKMKMHYIKLNEKTDMTFFAEKPVTCTVQTSFSAVSTCRVVNQQQRRVPRGMVGCTIPPVLLLIRTIAEREERGDT